VNENPKADNTAVPVLRPALYPPDQRSDFRMSDPPPETAPPSPGGEPVSNPFAGKAPGGKLPWQIDCTNHLCPLNRGHECHMVCGIQIGPTGRCNMAERLARAGVFKMERNLCRACGLPIVRRPPDDEWHHVGFVMAHPAEPEVSAEHNPGGETQCG